MKGRTLKGSGYRMRQKVRSMMTMTHHRRHLGCDGGQNPENTLEIEHPPKIRRILLLQHANKHDAEERQVHYEINKYAPAENVGPGDSTCACDRAPHRITLQGTQVKTKNSASFAASRAKRLPVLNLDRFGFSWNRKQKEETYKTHSRTTLRCS